MFCITLHFASSSVLFFKMVDSIVDDRLPGRKIDSEDFTIHSRNLYFCDVYILLEIPFFRFLELS